MEIKKIIRFTAAGIVLLLTMTVQGIEFQYDGASEKLQESVRWCAGEAQKIIGAGAVEGKYTNALFNGLMLEKLKSDGGFKGTKCNDVEINELSDLADSLWKIPADTLDKLQHKYLGATIASFKVRAVKQRAKDLFGSDGPENWRIPKEKEDPKRLYSVER
jgi:hypothetical protein